MHQGLFFGACVFCQGGQVIEPRMDSFGATRKQRAGLIGMVAEGDHIIKVFYRQVINGLGRLVGDVHTGLGHRLNGHGVEAVFFNPCGIGCFFC